MSSCIGGEHRTFLCMKLVYIVGYLDEDLETVHLSTFSSDGKEIGTWVGDCAISL